MKIKKNKNDIDLIGWREWLCMPELNVESIKAKVDTGARTSSLHVSYIKKVKGTKTIEFIIHPDQDHSKPEIHASAVVIAERSIKSSNGESSVRPVIKTPLKLGGKVFTVELTLVNRDMMGFRMLLGREAIRNRFLVHSGKSYLAPKKNIRRN